MRRQSAGKLSQRGGWKVNRTRNYIAGGEGSQRAENGRGVSYFDRITGLVGIDGIVECNDEIRMTEQKMRISPKATSCLEEMCVFFRRRPVISEDDKVVHVAPRRMVRTSFDRI